MVYAAGYAVTWALTLLTSFVQAPARAAQRQQLEQVYGDGGFTRLIDLLQNPVGITVLALLGTVISILVWLLLPYWVGRRLGGTGSWRAMLYVGVLWWVPVLTANSVLALILSGALSVLFLPLSVILDGVLVYGVAQTLRAVLGLSWGKALLAVAVPIALFTLLMCGIFTTAVIVVLQRLGRF